MIPPALLLQAYGAGYFPMAVGPGDIRWFSPDPRGILPLDAFHAPARLQRIVRQGRFEIRIDGAFSEVIAACASARRGDTWIDAEILASYVELHRLGYAHSVEAWQAGSLAGGLYGVALGGAFFGESMFSRVTDASKVALHALVERLRARDYRLLDIQWVTPHLQRFGAIEIPRRRYLALLRESLELDRRFGRPDAPTA